MAIKVFHRDRPGLLMPMIARDARLVIWPGAGAWSANMNYVDMQPGEENVPHVHPISDDTLYVLDGRGTVADLTNGFDLEFEAGQSLHVPAGIQHQVRADRGSRIESVGGPAPADLAILRRSGAISEP